MADRHPPDVSTHPLLSAALSRWKVADDAENAGEGSMRHEGEIDLKFLNLQQWDEADKANRAIALTIDQIGEPYRQLVGSMKVAKPAIQVSPVDSGADVDTAEVIQALIRHIEQTGHAKAAREEAFKGAVGPGWGYYRLYTEHEHAQDGWMPDDPRALFDQCIKYQPIENQFTVWWDPACPTHEPWKARYAFHIEDIPADEFAARYPGRMTTAEAAFQSTGVKVPDWFPEGSVRVADYFYVEETDGPTYVLLQDGRAVPLEQAPDGVGVIQQVTLTTRVVRHAKITGAEVLEGDEPGEDGRPTKGRVTVWPHIPIVPMYGESITVQGRRTRRGIVRPARDPQRMYNYQNSELAYELALAPKSKVIMAEGQNEGYEDQWKRAPSEAFPALLYKPMSLNGQPLPPPQIAQFTDPNKIQALVIAINQHKADLRSTTGWYDATDPSRKNTDQSGRAVLARKEAQHESAVTYKENYGAALLYEGMLLLGAIPKVYHRQGRILRLLGEDDRPIQPVTIGGAWQRKHRQGVAGVFAWGAARYDVTVSIGASYTSRRQEAAERQMALVEVAAKVAPPMAAAILPLTIRQMDIPGSQDLADVAERALPPELQPKDDEQQQATPEQLQAQLQQSEQMRQEAMQVVQQLQEAVKTDQVKAQADLEKAQLTAQADAQKAQQADQTKLAIAQQDNDVKLEIERMKIDAEFRLAQMKIDAELEKARIAAAAAERAQAREHAHGALMGEAEHGRALEQQAAKPNGAGA